MIISKKTYCKEILHSHKAVFWVTGTGHTLQNCSENTLLTFNGHTIHLSVGTGSLGLDGAGATGSPSASHNSSRWVDDLKVWEPQFFCEISDDHLPRNPSYMVKFERFTGKVCLSSKPPKTCPRCLWLAIMTASTIVAMEIQQPKLRTSTDIPASWNDLMRAEKTYFCVA